MQGLTIYLRETALRLPTELIPLFFLTYTTHILEQRAFGVQVWTYALVALIIGLVSSGIRTYAQSELNQMPADKQTNTRFFFEVWTIQLIVLLITSILLYVIFAAFHAPYMHQMQLQMLFFVGAAMDISWLYNGINKTRVVVRRDAVMQLLRFVPLILLVKSPNDLNVFILLMAITQIISNALLVIHLPKVLTKINGSLLFQRHLKDLGFFSLVVLLPQTSLEISKVLLYFHGGVWEVGDFYSAEVMVKVGVALVLGVGIAMMARVAAERQRGNIRAIQRSFYSAIEISTASATIIAVGVSVVGPEAAYWFLGRDYAEVGRALSVLSFVILLSSIRYSLALQQMAAERGFRNISIPVQIGAGMNVILSIAVVPVYGMLAAAWIAVISELIALILQVYNLRHMLSIRYLYKAVWKYLLAGVAAYGALKLAVSFFGEPYPKYNFVEALIGVAVYGLVIMVFRAPLIRVLLQLLDMSISRMWQTGSDWLKLLFSKIMPNK